MRYPATLSLSLCGKYSERYLGNSALGQNTTQKKKGKEYYINTLGLLFIQSSLLRCRVSLLSGTVMMFSNFEIDYYTYMNGGDLFKETRLGFLSSKSKWKEPAGR